MPDADDWDLACIGQPHSVAEVDETGYLLTNPDVRAAGLSASEHFVRYGQREGRKQAINVDRVRAQRERKLSRIRFRTKPVTERGYGEAANFITQEMIAEFRIPEAPPVSAHVYASFIADMVRANPDKLYLDIGAGLRSSVSINMVNTEIYPGVSTDVVCVGEDLPFEDAQFDFALCAAVLEHTRRPWETAREICRVVKPGGTIRVDYPFLQGVHGYPNHYFNATPEGSISLFESLCDIKSSTVESNNHPIHVIWWILSSWRSGLIGTDRIRFENLTVGDILSKPPEAQSDEGYCRNLSEETVRTIPAGSTLVAVRNMAPVVTIRPIGCSPRAPAKLKGGRRGVLSWLSMRFRRVE